MQSKVSEQQFKTTFAYSYSNGLYLNITSRCPTSCIFCIKSKWDWNYRGYNLKLATDPAVSEVLADVKEVLAGAKRQGGKEGAQFPFAEAVFCGYGESTYRLNEMKEVSGALRKLGFARIRLNTIGLGNLIHGRDIAPELAAIVDAVSISLNTADPEQYIELHRPLPQYRQKAFKSAVEFIRSCVKHIPDTTVTAVDTPDNKVDIPAVAGFADSLGAKFRLRPAL